LAGILVSDFARPFFSKKKSSAESGSGSITLADFITSKRLKNIFHLYIFALTPSIFYRFLLMSYDIPPPLQHKEKIIFGLTFSQLAYALPTREPNDVEHSLRGYHVSRI